MRFPVSELRIAECDEVKVVEDGNVIVKKVLYRKDGTEVVVSAKTLVIEKIEGKIAVLESQKAEVEAMITEEEK